MKMGKIFTNNYAHNHYLNKVSVTMVSYKLLQNGSCTTISCLSNTDASNILHLHTTQLWRTDHEISQTNANQCIRAEVSWGRYYGITNNQEDQISRLVKRSLLLVWSKESRCTLAISWEKLATVRRMKWFQAHMHVEDQRQHKRE